MRVITGTAKGRKLQAPAGNSARPTAAMVKEAIFSAIQFEVEGARVLDLFAGSGQMGVEALSRGARACVLVDNSKESLAVLRQNLTSTGLVSKAKVVDGDAFLFLRGYHGEAFDVAFLDPPYAEGLVKPVLHLLTDKMSENGVIICETALGGELPEKVGDFVSDRKRMYGKTQVTFYRRPNEEL